MNSSHKFVPKPSPLLAVACLAVVHRLRPDWLALPVQQAAQQEGVSAQRLARLASRAIGGFQAVVDLLTRRGRPPRDPESLRVQTELALTGALLGVATAILRQIPLRLAAIRHLVTGAFERLRSEHPGLTNRRYACALGVSERTFRHWRRHGRAPDARLPVAPEAPASNARRRARGPRRPRFGFDVTLPDTQLAADTTDLQAFGVPLKLMAVQDVGGRDADLLDQVLVSDQESAPRIARLVESCLSQAGGEQLVTDQGTPYLAEALRQVLEERQVEHAPQREGDPLGKATIERAFGSVKELARPLLDLTNRLAAAFPRLANPELARGAAHLVLTMLLRAYQAGARATRRADQARGQVDPATLARAAQESRERARADDRSARLLLARVHEAYQLPGCAGRFVRTFRHYPLTVLQGAERGFCAQAHRHDIARPWAYFNAIVHRRYDEHRREAARLLAAQQAADQRRREHARWQSQLAHREAHPECWVRYALDFVACHWRPGEHRLAPRFLDLSTRQLDAALDRLVERHGHPAGLDIARGVIAAFTGAPPARLRAEGAQAVAHLALEIIDRRTTTLPTTPAFAPQSPPATLPLPGPTPRPDPPFPLRI